MTQVLNHLLTSAQTFQFSSRKSWTILKRCLISISLLGLLSSTVFAELPKKTKDSKEGDLSNEQFQGVKLGDLLSDVTRTLGPPADVSKVFEDSVNQCKKRIYFYRSGLEIETCKTSEREEVYSLRVVKSPDVKTARQIQTGSTVADVVEAYPNHELRGAHAIIISDHRTHLKLRFLIDEGKVYEMSLYRDLRGQKNHTKRSLTIKRRKNVFH